MPEEHGSAKARVVGMGLFDGSKHTLLSPVDEKVEVPILDKRVGQVLSESGDRVQLMDMETYETFELPKVKEEPLASTIRPGVTVEYWRAGSRSKVMKLKSE